MRNGLIVVAVLATIASACNSGSSLPPASDKACLPGQSIACVGPAGCAGGQACREDGAGYEPCACSGTDGGAFDATFEDSALDTSLGEDVPDLEGGSDASDVGEAVDVADASDTTGSSDTADAADTVATSDAPDTGLADAADAPDDSDGGDSADATDAADSACVGSDPDCDGDGFKPSEGDCNDKDGMVNPDAYDFPADGIDNDCDGTIDNPVTTCDPTPGSTSTIDFARSADLCRQRSVSKTIGGVWDPVASVEFGTMTNGGVTSITHASATKIISAFGDNGPRFGATLFGMQTGPFQSTKPREATPLDGTAVPGACVALGLRDPDCRSLTSAFMPTTVGAQDYQEVRMSIRVPSNARAMSFDFAFFTTEFNDRWNATYNDAFFALVQSTTLAGVNVAKDSSGRAITVNSPLLQVCPVPPGPPGISKPEALSMAPCVGNAGDATKGIFGTLKGTFFDGAGIGSTDNTVAVTGDAGTTKYIYGGGSGWLTTSFAVTPGETIVIRFIVLDVSDGTFDSAAVVDHIRFGKAPPTTASGLAQRVP